jgi:hypothetical protein
MITNHRKYGYSFAELIDRLCIVSSKLVYGNVDKREAFEQEISDIVHDIQLDMDEGVVVTADILRAVIVLTQANLAIWINEDKVREYDHTDSPEIIASTLLYTHRLNSSRCVAKTRIQNLIGGRVDQKINYSGSAWNIKW